MVEVVIGLKVPRPTWRVISAVWTWRAAKVENSSGVKCSPAVGAATATWRALSA